jgi:hypothetical protein
MKKLAGMFFCLTVLCAVPATAQDTAPAAQNAPSAPPAAPQPAAKVQYNPRVPAQWEFSGGYVYRPYSPNANTTLKMNGAYVSADYNVFSWLGATVEGLGVLRKQGDQSVGTAQTLGILTALAGPQIYPLRHRKVSLFGHVLIGEGYYQLTAPAFGGFPSKRNTSSGFAYEAGMGLDVRIKSHWSIRLVEGDFGETSFNVGEPRQEGYRISGGIVYLRGQK